MSCSFYFPEVETVGKKAEIGPLSFLFDIYRVEDFGALFACFLVGVGSITLNKQDKICVYHICKNPFNWNDVIIYYISRLHSFDLSMSTGSFFLDCFFPFFVALRSNEDSLFKPVFFGKIISLKSYRCPVY